LDSNFAFVVNVYTFYPSSNVRLFFTMNKWNWI